LLDTLRRETIGEYEVYEEIGQGGMASVYLAHDIALDRPVAIKVMSPGLVLTEGMVERFKREARTAAALSHPHIIPIYAVRESDTLLFFVMKYVAGRPLDLIIRDIGGLPIEMVEAILGQVGGALAHAHRRGVVHRDVKPANIMIDEEGWAVVTDFGIAKAADASHLTSSGAAVGTPTYMSPEQGSQEEVTALSDQYSLGVVAYEMLTGRPPFAGPSVMSMMRSHFFDPPEPLEAVRPDCPPALARVVTRMLAKAPADRWSSIDHALGELKLRHLPHDHPVRTQMVTLARSGERRVTLPRAPTSPVPLGRAATTPSGWARAQKGVIALTLGAALLVGYLALWSRGRATPSIQSLTRPSIEAVISAPPPTPPVPRTDSVHANADTMGAEGIRGRPIDTSRAPQGRYAGGSNPRPTSSPAKPGLVPVPTKGPAAADSATGVSPPATPTVGILTVKANLPGVFLYVDGGTPIALLPGRWHSVRLGPGAHQLRAFREGCVEWSSAVVVLPDSTIRKNVTPDCDTPSGATTPPAEAL
jgi:tRNA A-37 threonylcarbamoyl transferase component Bud32